MPFQKPGRVQERARECLYFGFATEVVMGPVVQAVIQPGHPEELGVTELFPRQEESRLTNLLRISEADRR